MSHDGKLPATILAVNPDSFFNESNSVCITIIYIRRDELQV